MATWNDAVPTAANQILNDVTAMRQNIDELEAVLEALSSLALGTDEPAAWVVLGSKLSNANASHLIKNQGMLQRAKFTYNGGSTAYTVKVGGAAYNCSDKFCYWDSELTTTAIGSPVADTWYYLYLDYSAITSATAITNSELIWSSTAPTYSHSLRGWYNGSDRCIFAVLTNSTPDNILEFYHSSDVIHFVAEFVDKSYAAVSDTSWHDLTLTAPGFATKVLVRFLSLAGSGTIGYNYRPNGATAGSAGLRASTCTTVSYSNDILAVITDSSNIIEYSASSAGGSLSISTYGWYFPIGM